jgi:hypothetical protein
MATCKTKDGRFGVVGERPPPTNSLSARRARQKVRQRGWQNSLDSTRSHDRGTGRSSSRSSMSAPSISSRNRYAVLTVYPFHS